MVTDILLDEAVAVVTADDRVGQVHVFDRGLQLAAMLLGDLATEDDGDLVRLADGAVGVEQALAELVERGVSIKDQVVAEFDLREEQPVLAPCLPALCVAEERRQTRPPFTAAARQIFCGQGVGEFLEPPGCAAPLEGVRALLEVDVLLARAVGESVMLIERERHMVVHAHEHPASPSAFIEVVLHDPCVRRISSAEPWPLGVVVHPADIQDCDPSRQLPVFLVAPLRDLFADTVQTAPTCRTLARFGE